MPVSNKFSVPGFGLNQIFAYLVSSTSRGSITIRFNVCCCLPFFNGMAATLCCSVIFALNTIAHSAFSSSCSDPLPAIFPMLSSNFRTRESP